MKNLQGSEKQITWAEDIIVKWQEQLNKQDFQQAYSIANENTIFQNMNKTNAEIKKMIDEYINSFQKANEIIDLRNKNISDLLTIILFQKEKEAVEEAVKNIEEFKNIKNEKFITAYDIVDIYYETNEKTGILKNMPIEKIVKILQR